MATHRLALPSGFRLENYLFMDPLGKGGFGITYLARDLQLNRPVAVKELLPDSIATRVDGSTVVAQSEAHEGDWRWARERFLQEARVVAGFRHPHIVNVHRLIEANGTVYMVMDFLDGGSYEERLKQIGREPSEDSLRAVIDPLLDGLAEVHAAGLLHRDIKPDNILFNHRGEPVLADFGAAREMIGRTIALTSIVTPGYSPLEQYQSKQELQGAWTDIYALGAVMVRAITGHKPPHATDRLGKDTFEGVASKPRPGYSPKFLKAVDLALRMKPEVRPPTVAEWRKILVPVVKPPAAAPLELIAPKGGESWEAGTTQKIRWKSKGLDPRAGIRGIDVELWQGDRLVEKIATALEVSVTQAAWNVAANVPVAADYQILLVARNAAGEEVATAATGKFSVIVKRVAPPAPPPEPMTDKVVKFVAGALFLWLVVFGGCKTVWAKVFPHLPRPMTAWVEAKAPTWVPAGARPPATPPLKMDFGKIFGTLGTPTPAPLIPLSPHPLGLPGSGSGARIQPFHLSTPTSKPATPALSLGEFLRMYATPTPAPGGTPSLLK